MSNRSAWLRLPWVWAIPTALVAANAVWLFGLRGTVFGRGSMLAKQKAALESEVATLTSQLNALRGTETSLETLNRDLAALRREQLGSMRERLVMFLVDVSRRTHAAGLRPDRISYAAQNDKKSGLVHFTATFHVIGGYEAIRRCINLLEGSPDFVVVERLALHGDDSAATLDVDVGLTVGTYFADADTGMLRELGVTDLEPEVASTQTAPSGESQPTAPKELRTDFSDIDARVMSDLRQAVTGLAAGESAADEDVFGAPDDRAEPQPRRRSDRTQQQTDRRLRGDVFLGQVGTREVSGGR